MDADYDRDVSATVDSANSRSKPQPIVVDDSETEDDTDDELLHLKQSVPPTGASMSRTSVLNSIQKTPAAKSIVVDSETEDESDSGNEVLKKSASTTASEATADTSILVASASSTSIGQRKEQRPIPSIQSGPLGALSDRAQMEAERLARRKRILEDEEMGADSKRQRTTIASTQTPIASRTFYEGAFFPTGTVHANPRADGREAIGFQDIVGPVGSSDLKLAILSSFSCDPEWLKPHFNAGLPVILVAGSGKEESAPSMTNLSDNWVQTCPKLGKGGCMHMKYMLLFYSGRLRVVVSTANLISMDWKHLENSVFIQDVYNSSSNIMGNSLAPEKAKQPPPAEESFAMILESVLKATNVAPALQHLKKTVRMPFELSFPPGTNSRSFFAFLPGPFYNRGVLYNANLPFNSITDLSKLWDWSNVRAELVPSLAGKWEGWKRVMTTGHPRLMRAIATLGVATSKSENLVVECQGSSIGRYSTQWFNQFYISASGHSSALKAHLDIPDSRRKKLAYPPGVKVVFPTLATVKSTAEHGSRSLFCTRDKWGGTNFPRAAFHDSKSRAGRVLMHTKMIIGSITTQKPNAKREASSPAGWMYVGSHNFTYPAWGNLSGSASSPVLNVNNFELGVVVALKTPEDVNKASAWERPPKKYTAGDLPWLMDENPR
ncbi:hypothetical protein C8R44DRAFT_796164 [Mycena epipterygia]|nr:hypothetical protein C8R44DRAFT_796164 [Mycena epipterygia]